MRVRMRIHITGYRNSEPWPAKGGEIDLPDHEAADLITNGYAEPAGTGDPEPDAPRTVRRGRRRKGSFDEGATGDTRGSSAAAGGSDGAPADQKTSGTRDSGSASAE